MSKRVTVDPAQFHIVPSRQGHYSAAQVGIFLRMFAVRRGMLLSPADVAAALADVHAFQVEVGLLPRHRRQPR